MSLIIKQIIAERTTIHSSLELICGIIDYLGPYDWKKALESAVKTTIGCCIEPTVIDPEGYKKRFLELMQKEFQLDGK